jgi:hypothetical protein
MARRKGQLIERHANDKRAKTTVPKGQGDHGNQKRQPHQKRQTLVPMIALGTALFLGYRAWA